MSFRCFTKTSTRPRCTGRYKSMATKLDNRCAHREYREWLMHELDTAARELIRVRRALATTHLRGVRKHTKKRAILVTRLKVARSAFWSAWKRLPENQHDRAGAYAYLARVSGEESGQARAKWLSAGILFPSFITQGLGGDRRDAQDEQEASQTHGGGDAVAGGTGSGDR